MDMNNINIQVDKDNGALPSLAGNISILLVDHDTTSLWSIASQLKQQLYKVTPTQSAHVALSLFRAQKNYYDMVIAKNRMPEMEIYKFVHELQQQHKNVPVILMAENLTTDVASEALDYGVCYLISKPLCHRDIATLWHHVYTATGEMRSSTDTTNTDIEKYGCCDSAARNQKQRKLITTEIEKTKRRKNQIAESSNSSNDCEEEEDGCNSEKSRMTWTYSLDQKLLRVVNILGEQRAQPKTILTILNESGLTLSQISNHLQKYRDRKRQCVNLQKTVGPAMPTVQPATRTSIFLQGQNSSTANSDYMAARGAPQIPRSPTGLKPSNFVGYTMDYVKEILDALNYSSNDNVNAIISSGGFQIPKGTGGVQIAPSIDHNHSTYETPDASSHPILINGQALQASGYLTNRLEAPNRERAGETCDVMLSSDDLSNGIQAPNQEQARAGIDVIPATGHSSNGLQALNQELAGDIGIGMCGLGNGGTLANMNNDNFGEGTSANQEFDERIYQIIQDLEASGVNIWERID